MKLREDNIYMRAYRDRGNFNEYIGVRGVIWDAYKNSYEAGLPKGKAIEAAFGAYFKWGGPKEFKQLVLDVLADHPNDWPDYINPKPPVSPSKTI